MKHLVYQGNADFRRLSPEDLKKHGGDLAQPVVFTRGEPVEVNESVAKALLENPRVYGNFEVVSKKEAAKVEPKAQPARINRAVGTVDVKGASRIDTSVKARSKAR